MTQSYGLGAKCPDQVAPAGQVTCSDGTHLFKHKYLFFFVFASTKYYFSTNLLSYGILFQKFY